MRNNIMGFTMIELILVIMVIGTLGYSAIAAFIDFRNEAKKASLAYILGSVRSGIKNQQQRGILLCGNSANQWPSVAEVNTNISFCQVGANDPLTDPNIRFIDSRPNYGPGCTGFGAFCLCTAADTYRAAITINPFYPIPPANCQSYMRSVSNVHTCVGAACTNRCHPCRNTTHSNEYCYNPLTGDFWADSNTVVGGETLCSI